MFIFILIRFIFLLILICVLILTFMLILIFKFMHSYLYVSITRGVRSRWSHTYLNVNMLIYNILIRTHPYFQIYVYLDSYTTSTNYADHATINIIAGAHGIIVIGA